MVFLLSILTWQTVKAERIISCPKFIETDQSLRREEPGWHPFQSDLRATLKNVTFFDGPPNEGIALVNVSSRNEQGVIVDVWAFGDNTHVWFSCRYSRTNIELITQLDSGLKKCTVRRKANVQIDGDKEIISVICR